METIDLSKYKLKDISELERFRKLNEESFFTFYTHVVKMLNLLKEGEKFYIPDRCHHSERSLELFVKLVCFYIIDEMTYTSWRTGRIDLSEDCCWVSRRITVKQRKPKKHFYSKKG